MWYNPGIPNDSTPEEFLRKWALDNKMSVTALDLLSDEDRREVCSALRSLAIWYSSPIEADHDNPYWMEDEGYNDSDDDVKVLNRFAEALSFGDGEEKI